MEAKLEQPRPLQLEKLAGEMDPNPLADDLDKLPLTGNALPDERQHLGLRKRPMLLVKGPLESAGEPDRRSPRQRRYTGGRTRLRLTNWNGLLFHKLFFLKPEQHSPATKPKGSLRGASSVFAPRKEGQVFCARWSAVAVRTK